MARKSTSTHPLAQYRAANGLSQKQLAEALGVAELTVYRWEAGKRKIDADYVMDVSVHTKIPVADLRPDMARLLGDAQ